MAEKIREGSTGQGIIIKLWNVSAGNGSRTSFSQISDSIDYINNPLKTGGNLEKEAFAQVNRELSYVTNDLKTMHGLLTGGIGISDLSHATEEMLSCQEFYGKTDGRIATHGVISLPKEWSDPKYAGKLMLMLDEVMKSVWPDHQVVYAVHTNTEHLHIHFIVNTVSTSDGRKIHMDDRFMKQVMQPAVNLAASHCGFPKNKEWSKEDQPEKMSAKQIAINLRAMIDDAIERTDTFEEFLTYLRNNSCTCNVGKYLSIKLPGCQKAWRTKRLGKAYTKEAIIERLTKKCDPLVYAEHSRVSAVGLDPREAMTYEMKPIKEYRDMSPEEQDDVHRKLVLGKNPWQEARSLNWSMKKAERDVNSAWNTYDLCAYYSSVFHTYKDDKGNEGPKLNGNENIAEKAMLEILNRRRELADQKRRIRQEMKLRDAEIRLYLEYQKSEQHAFLYESTGDKEYFEDFVKCRECEKKLFEVYRKFPKEIAGYLEYENDELSYIKAVEKELSAQYLLIHRQYEKGRLPRKDAEMSFFKAVGHSSARYDAMTSNLFLSDLFYIVPGGDSKVDETFVTKDGNKVQVKVKRFPVMKDGWPVERTIVTVETAGGRPLEEIDSLEMDAQDFNAAVFAMTDKYRLLNCKIRKITHDSKSIVPEAEKETART